jgi:CheY-like chemotaxis protein
MRTFGGDLGILGLGNLLQVISMSQGRGFLTVSQGDDNKTIQFCEQGLRLVSGVRRALPLGQILVRSGRLTQAQLDELLAEQRKTAHRLGDLILEHELVSREAIDQALRDQVSEEIYELFAWPEGRFYFAESDNESLPNGAGPLSAVTLDPNMISLMVEAARRVDELKLIRSEIPVDQLIPQRTGPPATVQDVAAAGGAAKEILALVDGRHSIDQIVQISNYPNFTVLSTLFELKHRGLVSLEPAAPGTATETLSSGPSVLLIAKPDESRTETVAQLKGGGYAVVEATAWQEAEEWVHAAAAVVIDLSPDGGEGLAICDRLREDMKKSFIVLTEAAAQMEALQSGARYVLLKPVPGQVLLDRIAQLCRS